MDTYDNVRERSRSVRENLAGGVVRRGQFLQRLLFHRNLIFPASDTDEQRAKSDEARAGASEGQTERTGRRHRNACVADKTIARGAAGARTSTRSRACSAGRITILANGVRGGRARALHILVSGALATCDASAICNVVVEVFVFSRVNVLVVVARGASVRPRSRTLSA